MIIDDRAKKIISSGKGVSVNFFISKNFKNIATILKVKLNSKNINENLPKKCKGFFNELKTNDKKIISIKTEKILE